MALPQVTDRTFRKIVLKAPGAVVVDFSAEWCAPCRAMKPMLEKASEEFSGKALVVGVDVDKAKRTADRLRIMCIPTIAVFRKGREVHRITGAMPRARLLAEIKKHVGA